MAQARKSCFGLDNERSGHILLTTGTLGTKSKAQSFACSLQVDAISRLNLTAPNLSGYRLMMSVTQTGVGGGISVGNMSAC